jgi:hypothetical protein
MMAAAWRATQPTLSPCQLCDGKQLVQIHASPCQSMEMDASVFDASASLCLGFLAACIVTSAAAVPNCILQLAVVGCDCHAGVPLLLCWHFCTLSAGVFAGSAVHLLCDSVQHTRLCAAASKLGRCGCFSVSPAVTVVTKSHRCMCTLYCLDDTGLCYTSIGQICCVAFPRCYHNSAGALRLCVLNATCMLCVLLHSGCSGAAVRLLRFGGAQCATDSMQHHAGCMIRCIWGCVLPRATFLTRLSVQHICTRWSVLASICYLALFASCGCLQLVPPPQ